MADRARAGGMTWAGGGVGEAVRRGVGGLKLAPAERRYRQTEAYKQEAGRERLSEAHSGCPCGMASENACPLS